MPYTRDELMRRPEGRAAFMFIKKLRDKLTSADNAGLSKYGFEVLLN